MANRLAVRNSNRQSHLPRASSAFVHTENSLGPHAALVKNTARDNKTSVYVPPSDKAPGNNTRFLSGPGKSSKHTPGTIQQFTLIPAAIRNPGSDRSLGSAPYSSTPQNSPKNIDSHLTPNNQVFFEGDATPFFSCKSRHPRQSVSNPSDGKSLHTAGSSCLPERGSLVRSLEKLADKYHHKCSGTSLHNASRHPYSRLSLTHYMDMEQVRTTSKSTGDIKCSGKTSDMAQTQPFFRRKWASVNISRPK